MDYGMLVLACGLGLGTMMSLTVILRWIGMSAMLSGRERLLAERTEEAYSMHWTRVLLGQVDHDPLQVMGLMMDLSMLVTNYETGRRLIVSLEKAAPSGDVTRTAKRATDVLDERFGAKRSIAVACSV